MQQNLVSHIDYLAVWLYRFLERYRQMLTGFPIAFLLGRLVNEMSAPDISLLDGLMGLFSIAERPANWLSWLALFILILAPIFHNMLKRYYERKKYDKMFASLLRHQRDDSISPYDSLSIDSTLSLLVSSELHRGWKMSEGQLRHDTTLFSMPREHVQPYEEYKQRYFDEKRFFDDRHKVMLVRDPKGGSDSPTLVLETQEALYSQVQYYRDNIAAHSALRNSSIHAVMVEGTIDFPHALSMHMVVATKDNKILITERSHKLLYSPGTWSCSIEEQCTLQDLEGGSKGVLLRWAKRALSEELGLGDDAYSDDNLRILSVFLESEILNISLCSHVVLNINSGELDTMLHGLPRTDYEFPRWRFLTPDEVLNELFQPTRHYHPTARYRMLLSLIRHSGEARMIDALKRFDFQSTLDRTREARPQEYK